MQGLPLQSVSTLAGSSPAGQDQLSAKHKVPTLLQCCTSEMGRHLVFTRCKDIKLYSLTFYAYCMHH